MFVPLSNSAFDWGALAAGFIGGIAAIWHWSGGIERAIGRLQGKIEELGGSLSDIKYDMRVVRDNHLSHIQEALEELKRDKIRNENKEKD